MNKPEVLIIDDELQICKLLEITLRSNEYNVSVAHNAANGTIKMANHPPDVVILDIGLPDKNGLEVLKEIRTWYQQPVIILSVKNDEAPIVEALDNGANDYLVKPFRTGELLARLRTALRHSAGSYNDPLLVFGALEIDLISRTVKKNDMPIKLTLTEYNLLVLFAQNEGKALTHRYILKHVWGPSYTGQTQYLRVFVAQLRKKIEDDINYPKYILTEPGVGYRFTG